MPVQAVEHALNRAALGEIDHRKARSVEHVPGHEHVGSAEVHQAVAVGVGRRLIHHLNAFPVQHQLALRLPRFDRIGARRPGRHRKRRLLAGGRRHPVQDALLGQDRRVVTVDECRSPVAGGHNGQPRQRQRGVAADMIRIRAGVDDVANRPGRELLDLGKQLRPPCQQGRCRSTTTPSAPMWTPTLLPAPAIM